MDYKGWPADVVERRARAICGDVYDELSQRFKDAYLETAVDTLEADAAAGYVLIDRMKLQDIGQAAHCIAKAGPLAVSDLQKAYGEFDRIHYRISELLFAAGARRREG